MKKSIWMLLATAILALLAAPALAVTMVVPPTVVVASSPTPFLVEGLATTPLYSADYTAAKSSSLVNVVSSASAAPPTTAKPIAMQIQPSQPMALLRTMRKDEDVKGPDAIEDGVATQMKISGSQVTVDILSPFGELIGQLTLDELIPQTDPTQELKLDR